MPSGIDLQGMYASLFQDGRDLLPVLNAHTPGNGIQASNSADDREIISRFLLDIGDAFGHEPHPVFNVSPVSIRSPIQERIGETVEEVPGETLELDGIKAGLPGPEGSRR
jgi:hypothetical protein